MNTKTLTNQITHQLFFELMEWKIDKNKVMEALKIDYEGYNFLYNLYLNKVNSDREFKRKYENIKNSFEKQASHITRRLNQIVSCKEALTKRLKESTGKEFKDVRLKLRNKYANFNRLEVYYENKFQTHIDCVGFYR